MKYDKHLPPLSDRRLANTLGLALLVFYRGNEGWIPYLVKRTVKAGVFPGGIHCSASGACKWPRRGRDVSADDLTGHLLDEAHEELGLQADEVEHLHPVAFCRELLRGGKPQLFYCCLTHLSRKELAERRIRSSRVARELGLWEEVERERWYRSSDVILSPSRLRYGIETWGVTPEAAAALYFGRGYMKRVAKLRA